MDAQALARMDRLVSAERNASIPTIRPADADGLVGRVTQVPADYATVLLVNDGHGRRPPERGEPVRLFWRPEHEVPVRGSSATTTSEGDVTSMSQSRTAPIA